MTSFGLLQSLLHERILSFT